MEEKQREQKRARTVRSDYLADVDEVQAWIRQAELKVQDRSVEPAILREHLRQIQNELGTISDKLERLTKNGQTIVKNTRNDAEKELINSTIGNLTEQLAQVRSWLEEKKQIVGDTLDAWQRFLALYEAVKTWTEEKRQFLVEPLKLSTLVQARQRLHEYSTAVKSCKQVNKNLSDMGRELENIGQVTSVGDLPEKLAEAEEGKVQVEGQLLERNALLQEASEEWEQCERKMKDVRSWMEKARQTLELPQNKKKPLRDQHAIREKMLSDIAIQKTKITISVEKLEVHFRSGIVGDNRVKDTADDLIAELNSLHSTVKEQTTSLEACLAQIDQYQQEIQQLRQHIVQVEQQLRTVLSPTYMPNDREKALQEQQSLQQRMEDWKQRSKTLVDQIHTVDPYYVPTNEYRFIGQASYADIAAGRTNSPSSRNCSPYRYQREATPPTTTVQVLPEVMRAQKLTVEYSPPLDEPQVSKKQIQENNTSLNKSKSQLQTETHVQMMDNRGTIGAEEYQQSIPEVIVESLVARRGRSPTRKTNSSKVRDSKVMVDQEGKINRRDNHRLGTNSRQEAQTEFARNTLAPREEGRGRSPSPMWVPGSTSYADILRGCMQTTQANTAPVQPPRQKMVSLSGETRRGRIEVPQVEQVTVDIVTDVDKFQQTTEIQQVAPTQEIQEDVQIVETYCQSSELSTEKAEDQSYAESEPTNWADEALQDYDVLQRVKPYQNAPTQPQSTEIYDYMIPEAMPELVGFISSHLGTYPVSSYVYAPSGHHQQVQQLDTINLNPYNNGSLAYAPEHYVAQTAYLSASDIYQQTPMQQPQCPVNDMRHATAMLVEKPVEVPVVRQPEVSKDVIATEPIDKPEQQKPVNISNVETSTTNKTVGRDMLSSNIEIKGQTFSYAQILSHGLSPRIISTRIVSELPIANHQSKERSDSPKESLELSSRELSPLQEPKLEQDSQSFVVTPEQSRQSKENDWDTMKKREVRKRQQQPNDKTKQMDERKSRKLIDKSKEKQKKKKLSPPKQLETRDEPVLDKISGSPVQKEEKLMQQEKQAIDLIDTNLLQEKKRRQKKKKVDKSVGDEIDKALKEIEDMDKHKTKSQKDKPKEQNKEQNKPRDSINETVEKCKDETDKKQSKFGEKFKKSGKSKEAMKVKETMSMEHTTLSSQFIASDQNIPKDNAEGKEDTKGAKVSDSKDEEKVQKDVFKEMLKDQFQIDNIHINSDKSDSTIKCKNKIDKNIKAKEQSREFPENKVQDQSDDLSNNKKDKINIVDKNNVTEIVKLSASQKIELENTNEKTSSFTKIENIKKHKDASKKEKKIKSKELKLDTKNSNINQEVLEINTKEIEDKSLELIKSLIDTEIKDISSKALDITKIVSEVNENTKSKINSRKKDKTSKSKIKFEVDTSSIIPTSKVLDEIKINLNDTEKNVVPEQQVTVEAKIPETAVVVKEISKQIVLLPKTVQQITQDNVQIDITYKNDKTYDSVGVKELIESKEVEHYQTNAKQKELKAENFPRENLETTDTMDEKEVINSNTKMIEKIEKQEVEKCQTKTAKQKKFEKMKSNVQDKTKRKEDNTEISQFVEDKSIRKKDDFNIESLIAPTVETVVQEQSMEIMSLAEQHVSVPSNSCLVQSKTDIENKHGVKISDGEDIGQVNKRAPETVPKSKKKSKSKDKAVIQSTASIHDIKSTENSELKDVVEIAPSAIVELITSINEEVSRNETMKLPNDNDKSEAISTEKPIRIPETDLTISKTPENIEIISTTETFPKEFEVSSEINSTAINMEEKYQNVKNGKLDHQQEAIIKNEDKTDINDKDSLIKEKDIEKLKNVASEEKTCTKRKERLSPKHIVEQTKQSSSFYDKFQEEIVFKNDSTKRKETPKLTTNPKQEKFSKNLSPLAKIDNIDIKKMQELPKKDETEFGSKVSSDSIDKAQVYEKHINETLNNSLESEQPSSTGKALIIEKMVTTVTTTTSVPGSVKVKPPDVKSVKSVEIIENIPLPKIVGSKVTELITLRPETVEASLTTTYARVPNNSLVGSYLMQSDQLATSQKIGSTSAIPTENIVISDELALFGSVRDRKKVCPGISESCNMSKKSQPIASEEGDLTAQLDDNMERLGDQLKVEVPEEKRKNDNMKKKNTIMTTTSRIIAVDTILQNDNIIESQNINNLVKNDNIVSNSKVILADSNILIEGKYECIDGNKGNAEDIQVDTIDEDIQEKAVDEKIELEMKCESKCTISKVKRKEIPESMKTKKQIVPEHLLDLIKPYAIDRHVYNHAESNFYRYFKVVKIVKEPQRSTVTVQTRPESIERIVQESVMKPAKSVSQETCEVNRDRRHALIIEAPKYPITSFYEFESQWIKMKSISEKSVSFSSDDSEVSIKTAIVTEKQTVEEKDEVSDLKEDTTAIKVEKLKTIETNDGEDKDKKSGDLQQSVHLVSNDSWISILDEPMMIEDDFDDISNSEENTINETANKELIDVESQDRINKIQMKEEQLSGAISEVLEVPSCIESIEEIREPAIILISTSANNIPITDAIDSTINTMNDSTESIVDIAELNVSVESSTEKISGDQLIDAGAITDTNIQADKIIMKNEIEQDMLETKTMSTKAVHLESDDAWMALLEEKIIIDDNFDELETETVKDDHIKKREEEDKKKEVKTKQRVKGIKEKKPMIEKQEDKLEKKESIIEEQKEKIEKEIKIEKPGEEIEEKKVIEKSKEETETKEPKTEVLNNTSLIAVKDEYHASIKDIQNETSDEKQSDRTKNQPKKKKESKHVKVIKTKDQAKIKAAKKQCDVEIKTDAIEGDLSLRSNLEKHKILDNEADSKTKEAEKILTVDEQTESKLLSNKSKPKSQDTIDEEKPLSKREERKLKSDKKFKKQNQKSEITLKEKSATAKYEGNIKTDENIVFFKATEIESNVLETSAIMQKQQESKDDVPKYDSRLNPNAKSWASIVGTRDITETTVISKDDSLNTQTSAITRQDINDSVTNIVKQSPTSIVCDSCEIPLKEETLHSSSLEISKNVIEELKATIVDEIVKPIAEKSTILPKQLKEGNKSYAQVTARRTSPQTSQEETYLVKPVQLKTDHLAIDVKTLISDEVHEGFSTNRLQSPLEQDDKQVDEMIEQSSDHQTVIVNLISQKDSIPWVEEIEKETLAVSTTSASSINIKDNEMYAKLENTWAAIVGKKSVESPEVNDISNLEQNLSKPEQIMEQWSPTQVQIYVEEAPKQEPIENLVQVDEQGFIEFVNRKELRSRRSRSRSRSARRDNRYATGETSNSVKNKEIKTLDIKSDNSENVKAKEKIENETKQPVQKHENEQNAVDESDELAKIIKEEITKPSKKAHVSKSKNKDKQKNDSNEQKNQSKMQLEENKIHNAENKIIQETKPEPDVTIKGKKNKSKKNKSGKDYMKQQVEVNEQKELKHIEEPKEDKKSTNENEIEHYKIQLENIEDQSMKGIQLIKDTEHAQENECKDVKALSIIDQDNTTKPKKKKNKKGKLVIEQLSENTSDIDKKTVRDLEEKIKLLVESKLDDEVKIKPEEAITADITCNVLMYPENGEIPAQDINKQKENIKQVIVETTEQKSFERKIIVDELRNAYKESHLEKVEKTLMEEKEIPKLTKAEKRKQKKKSKIAQNKFTDLSDDINVVENIKTEEIVKVTEETAPSKNKIDDKFVLKNNDELITEIQSVQIEIEKPLEKPVIETVIEDETLLSQIIPIKDKQKPKSKSKLKKEKRQQDDKTKFQNFTMTLTTDSTEIKTPSTTGNIEIKNLSNDIVECDITQPKQKNVEDQVLDDELTEILQSPKSIIDKNDFSVATEIIEQEDIKESSVSPIEKEVDEEPIKIKDSLLSKKKHKQKQKSLKKQVIKTEDKEDLQQQQDLTKCPKEDVISIIDKTVIANETIHVTSKETDIKTESSLDFTKKEENNIVSIESEEKLEISNERREEGMKNKLEINEKQIETNDAVKLTISWEKIEINEQIIDQKENVPEAEEASADYIILTEKIELPQTEETQSKLDDTSKLYDVTVNNDITKIESVLISDETKNSKIETDASTSINDVYMQIKPSCDSINAVIKHSPPSDKLSSAVQQSFEDENKLKRVASIEQKSSDVLIEPAKSKVQFYIADEILVLNPDRRKYVPSTSFLQEQLTTDSYSSWFLSIDDSFWLNKRPYHEAERIHFESLALHRKKSLSRDSKRDSDDCHRPRDRDDDNSGGGGGGSRSRDSCGNSHSLLGTPQTERMIADLPGGMCSWSDYSTYLSSESERSMDHSLPLGRIEDLTFDSGLSLDSSLLSDVQSSSPEFLLLSASSHNPQTELRIESLADAEITSKEYPAVSSSSSFQSPDYPSTCTSSSTFAHLRPQSKLHLGREMREGSVQWCSPNGEVERETAKGEAERRIRRIQDVEEGLASLQTRLLNLEGTMGYLPRDNIESMLSFLMTILTELHAYDEEATQLEKQLHEIPADIESQRLLVALTGIHTRVTSLLDQAEQGRVALEQARVTRERRGQEIHTYKLFLEETDAWLKNVVSKLHEQQSFNTSKALQEELMSRVRQVSELESLPEVSALAIALKEALLDVINRLQRKQQVSNAFQSSGAFANITTLHGASVA